MQILERQDAARKLFSDKLEENTRVCKGWKTWFSNTTNLWNPDGGAVAFQDDSGI